MNEIVDEYIQFDMNKFFNISLNEYLEVNNYTRKILINKAVDMINKLNEQMENLKSHGSDVSDFKEFEV